MGKPLRVLIVEDRERDAAILARELRRGGYDLHHERVETGAGMAEALERTWDLVLSDYALPQFSALAAVRLVAKSGLDLPFIVVSGSVGEEAAVEIMREGAHDFLFKSKLARMIPVIERELAAAARRAQHRDAQARLRQMEKMEALGQLTGGIAHDFNNILAVIIGMTELAASGAGDTPMAAMLRQIDESAERGAQLVQRLLAFARKKPLETHIIDLNGVVTRAATMLDRTLGEHIVLHCALAHDLWPALADASQLEDAILNLAVNARDAMPEGGRIGLETANVTLDEAEAARNVDAVAGDHVALSVTDTGVGMAPGIIERVFEPFFTTKPVGRGTGLGLSMVYGFVKQSGGHVQIRSELGKGTTITLFLPKANAQKTAMLTPGDDAPVARATGTETILVVEDNAAVRKMAVSVLEGLGYRIRQAADGRIALDILRSEAHVDLLFSDMVMPNGISGHQLVHLARDLRPGIRALLTTGYAEEFTNPQTAADRDIPVLPKPYRKEALAAAVRTALAG